MLVWITTFIKITHWRIFSFLVRKISVHVFSFDKGFSLVSMEGSSVKASTKEGHDSILGTLR